MNDTFSIWSAKGSAELSNGQLASPGLTPVAEEPIAGSLGQDGDQVRNCTAGRVIATPHAQRALRNGNGFSDERRDRAISSPMERPSLHKRESSSLLGRRMTTDSSAQEGEATKHKVLKLSAAQLEELTRSPDSIPTRRLSPLRVSPASPAFEALRPLESTPEILANGNFIGLEGDAGLGIRRETGISPIDYLEQGRHKPRPSISGSMPMTRHSSSEQSSTLSRPRISRAASAEPPLTARYAGPENHRVFSQSSRQGLASAFEDTAPSTQHPSERRRSNAQALPSPPPSPSPESLPLPPFSLPTYLHLELSVDRPSPLYVHHFASSDAPYEPSRAKFERLLNFLLLPLQLERVLFFGALTCLDAWLFAFTILPLRFLKALWIFLEWALESAWSEVQFVAHFIYQGLGRLRDRRARAQSISQDGVNLKTPPTQGNAVPYKPESVKQPRFPLSNGSSQTAGTAQRKMAESNQRHRHSPPVTSMLQANHKADIMQGLLIIFTCTFLMQFDASRMYHGIRGQSAVKLYVIYNMLEVCDRLFSAIGQDIIECLFSPETLDRKPNGRSNIITPFWMFLIALVYNIFHSGAFLYQVITLNVAVNSYSNALLTLLLSNQFVEIKGAVFKKFEKENLFQMTCADVVERFQLWLMLLIIALRNIAELGGLSIGSSSDFTSYPSSSSGPPTPNSTATVAGKFSILPHSFTVLPLPTGAQLQPLTPFLLVLASEMLVDWLKHGYIAKFNAYKPRAYARFLDVLAKDYYSNAFGSHNVVRRLGLPVIPLVCLFIRAILQTYHMFLATNISPPATMSTSTSLALDEATATASPAIAQIDHIFRNALGRSSFGGGSSASTSWFSRWTLDDVIALTTMIVFFLAVFLLLLGFKLVLGMVLLSVARDRYRGMKEREGQRMTQPETKRLGGWGVVEIGEERRKMIYEGDEKRLEQLKEKERKARIREEEKPGGDRLESVDRYAMVAKRIW